MAPPRRPWFRLYTEVLHDRKIRRIDPAHRWLWIAVLAAARQSPEPGVLLIDHGDPLTLDDLADLSALPVKTVRAGLASFGDMIEWDEARSCWWVPKFRERQYESDVSTDRVSKHRQSNGDVTPNETGMERTQRDREQSPENRTHRETTTTNGGRPDEPSSSSSVKLASLIGKAVAAGKGKPTSYARGVQRNLIDGEDRPALDALIVKHGDDLIAAAIEHTGLEWEVNAAARTLGIRSEKHER